MRGSVLWLVIWGAWACSVTPPDYGGRACPCAAGYVCRDASGVGRCSPADAGPADDGGADAGPDASSPPMGELLASNVGEDVTLDAGAADVVIGGALPYWIIDTGSGTITGYATMRGDGEEVLRAGGEGTDAASGIYVQFVSQGAALPSLAVFAMRSLRVEPGAVVFATGDRPLVILAFDAIVIEGEIALVASRLPSIMFRAPAAGVSDRGPGAIAAADSGGGGGGSFGTRGGEGGKEPGAAPGMPYGTAELIPLLGGSRGGRGKRADGVGHGTPGEGGGAIQLSAGRIVEVRSGGVVDASGLGAETVQVAGAWGGAGGGSGGAVLIEAPTVVVDGAVGANGGAGSRGGLDSVPGRDTAASGSAETFPATGTAGDAVSGGGGSGSDEDGVATDGGDGTTGGGGGGGGGAGRIRINTATGTEPFSSNVVPRPGSGATTIGVIRRRGST